MKLRTNTQRDTGERHPVHKPRLLCIEGPAGSGKTTLCRVLSQRLEQNNVPTSHVPEFSATALGVSLTRELARFAPKPAGRPPEVEFMLCMADKFASLAAAAASAGPTVVVADRGFITQAVLGIPAMTDQASRTFAHRLQALSSDWLRATFTVSTFVLSLPFEENLRRLAQRLQRPLSPQEQDAIRREREAYNVLAGDDMAQCLGTQIIDCLATPDAVADDVLARMHRNALEHT